jgi:trehalose-6-phosphate synthase
MLARDRSLADCSRYLLLLAPPPPHLNQYRRYMNEIGQAIREVNGKLGKRGEGSIILTVENNYPLALAAMQTADTLVAVPIADAACSTALSTPLINRQNCSLIISETSSAAAVLGGAAAVVSPTDAEALSVEMERAMLRTDQERKKLFEKAESAVLGIADGLSLTLQFADLLDAVTRKSR